MLDCVGDGHGCVVTLWQTGGAANDIGMRSHWSAAALVPRPVSVVQREKLKDAKAQRVLHVLHLRPCLARVSHSSYPSVRCCPGAPKY
jgi:hypothetical protein